MTAIRDLDSHGEPHVTVAELAAYWKVTERTVQYQIAKGALPCVRVGRAIRIRTDDARRFGRVEPVEFGPLGSVDMQNRSN